METNISVTDRSPDVRQATHKSSDPKGPLRLWVALVEHDVVPGTRAVLFFQDDEPSDDAVFERFSEDASPEDLAVVGLYDLAHVGEVDQLSNAALLDFARNLSAREIVDGKITIGTTRGRPALNPRAPRLYVGELDHTWTWNEDGRMEVKCRVVLDLANHMLVAAQVRGYESWDEATSDQNDDLAKSLFVVNKVADAPGEFDFAEVDRLPEWAVSVLGV
jgi:hypothetical protein